MSYYSHSPPSSLPLSPASRSPSPPSAFRSPVHHIFPNSPPSARHCSAARVQFLEPNFSPSPPPNFAPDFITLSPEPYHSPPSSDHPYHPPARSMTGDPPDPLSPPISPSTHQLEHLTDRDYPLALLPGHHSPPHRSATKNSSAHHPASRRSHPQPGSDSPRSARPSVRQLEGPRYQNLFPYSAAPQLEGSRYQNLSPYSAPYQNQPVQQLPTPPQSKSTYQQPAPPYQNHSVYRPPTPPYPSYSIPQQHTSPYHNYTVHQQPTPQQKQSVYAYGQLTPPLSPTSGQESTAKGLSHHYHILDQNPDTPGEAPDPFTGNTTSSKFMEKLLQHTIIGAEFDSSDRYPPPRCHPRTRLAIIERCKAFAVRRDAKERLRWVVGSAGIGKSAVMQTVAEETNLDVTLGASVFFTADKQQDGTKMFTTIAYQFAAKFGPYRRFIRNEITRDPSLLRKSLQVQFNQFIVKPFIHQRLFSPSSQFLIIIDGLDRCDTPLTQRDLLGLISDFCMTHPTSPVVWIVASRPEPHITSFFDDVRFAPAYTKEEIVADSDKAREDVRLYLHAELRSIQLAYPSLKRKRQWPSELEFQKIATAAGGLFAYASAVVRYIGDPRYRGPGSRINKVLVAIDADPGDNVLEKDYPLAQIDALYDNILSKVPDDIMVDTRKLLLLHLSSTVPFRLQCNLLGLTEDAAYTAMDHIRSVVRTPEPANADDEFLQFFHKSFEVYLCNFKRSRFSRNVQADAQKLLAQCSMRIVEEVSNGVANGEDMNYDSISLSWPGDDLFDTNDNELRLKLYQHAITTISPTTISSTILSRVPDNVMSIARKLLLLRLYSDWSGDPFRTQCNLLGLAEGDAYGALCHACSIVRVPEPDKSDDEPLQLFPKSFEDHLSDFGRPVSGLSSDVRVETEELVAQVSLRIVEETRVDSDGMTSGEVMKYENVGYLKGGPGVSKQVSLSWPGGDRSKITDDELKLRLYSGAIANISLGFKADVEAFVNMPCFRVLTTRFAVLGIDFPFSQVREFVFDKCRRELTEGGLLKQVPLRALDFAAICGPINLHFAGSTGVDSSSQWNSSCTHEKEETSQGWSTSFGRYEEDDWSEADDGPSNKESDTTEIPRFKFHAGNEFHWSFLGEECLWAPKQCNHCLRRLLRYVMDNPDGPATVFVDSTELCYAELSFVDPEDGGSQWRYRFFHSGPPKM